MKIHIKLNIKVTAVAAGLLCSHAFAQEKPSDDKNTPTEKLQRIEITGSNIKRVSQETAVPVQILTRADIEASGATTVKSLLDDLSSTTGGLSDIEGGNRFSPGASAIAMRNLGAQSTLILLNGRRIAPYGLADYSTLFSNIDSLPLSAVERVEILKSGASAIYGSDAVAGVINVITRRDFKKGEVSAAYANSVNNSLFGSKSASATIGRGDLTQDRFNAIGHLSYFERSPLFYSQIVAKTDPRLTKYSPSYGTPSTFSYPGNIIGQGPLANCQTTNAAGLCVYDRYERFQALPSSKRLNGMFNVRFALSTDTELFLDSMFSSTRADYESAYQIYGGPATGTLPIIDIANSAVKVFRYVNLPASHPLNMLGRPAELRYRFRDAGGNNKVDANEYRLVAGAKGVLNDFDWEVAGAHMSSKVKTQQRGNFSDSGFKQLVGDYNNPDADFFNKQGGYRIGEKNSPDILNRLFPEYGYIGKISQTALDGKISGNIFKLPAGMLAMAIGGEVRNEKVSINPSSNLMSGDIVGNGVVEASSSRTFYGLFSELSVPILKELEAQVATRVDKFPGFAAHFSPKLALRYQPTKDLILRGTIEEGFRAPNLTESAESTKYAFQQAIDPARCPQARSLQNDLRTAAALLTNTDANKALLLARADQVVGAECGSVPLITRNNPDLKPETSRSFSLGGAFEASKNLSFTADYWNIQRRDEIDAMSGARLLSDEGNGSAAVQRSSLSDDVTFSRAEQEKYGVNRGKIQSIQRQFQNLNRTKTDGLDFEARLRTDTPIGKLQTTVTATWIRSLHSWDAINNSWTQNYVGFYGIPQLKSQIGFRLDMPKWTHNLTFSAHSGFKSDGYIGENFCAANNIERADCNIRSNVRTDYYVAYNGFKDLTLSLGIINLFNKGGDYDVKGFLNDGGGIVPQQFGDAQRASYRLNATYRF